jgi:pyruvate formate lyase activating enzyme
MRSGQRGACFVRRNDDGAMVLTSYGRASGFCVDPIEKKPLYHFLPGSATLSFGSVGCHLACRHCQNWHLSSGGDERLLGVEAGPDDIAEAAVARGCGSVAFTYNDPIPSLEFVVDVAAACRARHVRTVAVTNGYIEPEARSEFFSAMDAANVDLKAFTDAFYRRNCAGTLQPVLDTLVFLAGRRGADPGTWFEVTTLLIPGENDTDAELDALSRWIASELGADVPLHFSAFRPAWRMMDRPATPPATVARAREIALRNGLRHVYTGNVHDPAGGSTYCPECGATLIRRAGFDARAVALTSEGACRQCRAHIAGVWA